jgi:hypothetical protein
LFSNMLQGIGLQGLNKGVTATIARNGVFNMVYFGFYHSVKGYLPEYKVLCSYVIVFSMKFIVCELTQVLIRCTKYHVQF